MKRRINFIRRLLAERGAEAALLTFLPDIRWACGFSGSNSVLLVRPDHAHLITDGRYREQARREVEGAQVHVPGYKLLEHVKEENLLGDEVVLYQSDHATVAELERLQQLFPSATWQPAPELLTRRVAAKDEQEVGRIRQAQQITDRVFEHVLEALEPGRTEKEVAAEIVYQHLRLGADKMSFDPIVASGEQGALPHARPTDREIQAGDLVVIDMGCFVEGYASDMTRTVAVGEPDDEARTVYQVVLKAQKAAVEAAEAGLSSKELDGVARSIIEDEGYGEYFSHGLGHGLGLQVHEWPKVSYHTDEPLPAHSVVTIEPGVYLPGRLGVRIEDIILLQEGGSENLTGSPKDELIVV